MNEKSWIDVGCSTGLLVREAAQKGYTVLGYDINKFSLLFARFLSWRFKNSSYSSEDFRAQDKKFDVVSATSLLSVVDDKEETLKNLVKLLKNDRSTLVIIEPTEHLSPSNVKKLIVDFKSFWYYKGLLLWAKARQNKSVESKIFDSVVDIQVKHTLYFDKMIRVSYISYT